MIVMPAIDLYNGSVVRLTNGNFECRTVYGNDPYEVANACAGIGCTHLHVIDLEGAKDGSPKHLDVLSAISKLGLIVEFGGGIRTVQAIKNAKDAGAFRVILGSMIFEGEEIANEVFKEFGNSVMPALDTKENRVMTKGWNQGTGLTPHECMVRLFKIGFRSFLITSIESDGNLQGPNFDLYERLVGQATSIIAAGGVTEIGDIIKLKEIGLAGAVVGKALYERGFNLGEALMAAK
jgi:phosphoribosylformimino-5-aminoimidazole carboxamide ribotide isomerase